MTIQLSNSSQQDTLPHTGHAVFTGTAVCVGAAVLSYLVGHINPSFSPLLVAIVLGALVANTLPTPQAWQAGFAFASRHLLRAGVVLLGLQIAVGDVASLGLPMLSVIALTVVGGISFTLALGKRLGVSKYLTILIAYGFSICGAAAIAGVSSVAKSDDGDDEDDTIGAIALVVIFGSLLILLVPALARALGLDDSATGAWAGASIHEVAQVIATGGTVGAAALSVAIVVKLTRVMMLAPMTAALSIYERRNDSNTSSRNATSRVDSRQDGTRPPLVPLFIIGFALMVVIRSVVPVPEAVLSGAGTLQTILLAAAMFALGHAVKAKKLLAIGARPLVLAILSTVMVMTISLVGILLVY